MTVAWRSTAERLRDALKSHRQAEREVARAAERIAKRRDVQALLTAEEKHAWRKVLGERRHREQQLMEAADARAISIAQRKVA